MFFKIMQILCANVPKGVPQQLFWGPFFIFILLVCRRLVVHITSTIK